MGTDSIQAGRLVLISALAVSIMLPPVLGSAQPVYISRVPAWTSDEANQTRTMALGDVDGDGDLDVVCGNVGGEGARLYLNEGGTFLTSPWRSDTPRATNKIALADIDRDGDLDLICGNNGQDTIYLNQGGVFAMTPDWSSIISRATTGMTLGDVDGDGFLDLVIANGDTANVYLNNGGGFSGTPDWRSATGQVATDGMSLGDLNGDGDLDLVVEGSQEINIHLNSGSQGVVPYTLVPDDSLSLGPDQVFDLVLGDINGDGFMDLVLGGPGQNHAYVYDDSIFNATPVWTSAEANFTLRISLGDVDGDGDLDVLCANANTGPANRLYLNDGGTLETSPVPTLFPGVAATFASVLGDVDGDGDLDVLLGNTPIPTSGGGHNTLFVNEARPYSTAPDWVLGPVSEQTRSVAFGDVDRDGDLDLMAGNRGQKPRLHLNSGSILDTAGSLVAELSISEAFIALEDLDDDDYPDLVVGRGGTDVVYSNSDGMFAVTPSWISPETDNTADIDLKDVDGDGDIDLVIGNSPESGIPVGDLVDGNDQALWYSGDTMAIPATVRSRLYRNISNTIRILFEQVWFAGEGSPTALGVVMGDINNDGHHDLVVGNNEPGIGQKNVVYLNNGEGVFSTVPDWFSERVNQTWAVDLGDVDGDGYLDLVCGNRDDANTLYLNENGMLREAPSWTSGEQVFTGAVRLADVDNDGDLDLLCGNRFRTNNLYLNDEGVLSVVPVWSSAGSHDTRDIATGDLDGDGDCDVAFANLNAANTVYLGRGAPVFKGDPSDPRNQLPNNSAHLRSVAVTDKRTNVLSVVFRAVDVESDSLWIIADYKFEGSSRWTAARIEGGEAGKIGPFQSSPEGVVDSLEWDISSVPDDTRDIILRLRTVSLPSKTGLIQYIPSYQKRVVQPLAFERPAIVLDTGSLSFPTVTLGDTVSMSFQVGNSGNTTLDVGDIQLPSSEMSATQVDPIPPAQSVAVTVSVAPRQETSISGVIRILTNDPLTPVDSISVLTDVRGLGFETKLLTLADELPLGEPVTVLVTPHEAVHIEDGHLFFRRRGDVSFRDSVQLLPLAVSNELMTEIPGHGITELGLEYYARVENSGVLATDPLGAPVDFYSADVAAPTTFSTEPIPNENGEFMAAESIYVHVLLPDGAVFKEGEIAFRRGGAVGGHVLRELTNPGGSVPMGIIPGEIVGARGVEYWVSVETATDSLTVPADNPTQEPLAIRTTVEELDISGPVPGGSYRLFSIPLDMGVTSILEVISDDVGAAGPDKTKWRMFRRVVTGYEEFGVDVEVTKPFEPGRAYWLITKTSHQLDTQPGRGWSTPTDEHFAITLTPGWNLIGDPFNFMVDWASLWLDTLGTAADTLQMKDAGLVVEPPIGHDVGQGYRKQPDAELVPFEGYWVYNLKNKNVNLMIPPREAITPANNRAVAGQAPDAESEEWVIEIHASSVRARDGYNQVGVKEDAREQRDRYDRYEPPMSPGEAISVYFPHSEWKIHPGNYAVDIRGRFDEKVGSFTGGDRPSGRVWRFDLAKNFSRETAGDEVTLEFVGVDGVPDNANVLLVDRHLGRLVDLRVEYKYVFYQAKKKPVGKDDEARFLLLAGDEAFVEAEGRLATPPGRTALHQNHPNPFNPSTIIRYDVAKPGRVSLKVYDVSGAMVAVLENRHRKAGRYEVGWNGENQRGEKVASGIYFYQLETAGFSRTRKMLLLK